MPIDLRVYNNGDHTCLVWCPKDVKPIPGCIGFTLRRQLKRQGTTSTSFLRSAVGFQANAAPPPAATAWLWPLQRYMWWDYFVEAGDVAQYQVVPVVLKGGAKLDPARPLGDQLALAEDAASPASAEITVTSTFSPSIEAFFNRGIIASQWVAREIRSEAGAQRPSKTALTPLVKDPKDPLRLELGGLLLDRIVAMLKEAADDPSITLYAALYELNDQQMIDALSAIGKRCNLILGNGAFKPPTNDENTDIRAPLRSKVNLFDRLVTSGHFAHNKFVVVCRNGAPEKVLSGSTNWTFTGLCTQANNGIIISDKAVASAYLDAWHRLHDAGNAYPSSLIKANSQPRQFTVDGAKVSVWCVPTDQAEDMQQARQLVNGAQHGILFLFFNPGTFQSEPDKWTLLQSIIHRHEAGANPYYNPGLYIRGVVNQEIAGLTEGGGDAQNHKMDPAAPTHPVKIFSSGKEPPLALGKDVLVPAAIKSRYASWEQELLSMGVMIHSKVVVIDPFGAHPVVMTGSHNLGIKASSKNDDNLVIVENDAALAQAYAANIIAIYQEYRWRHYVEQHAADPQAWHGLQADATWQSGHLAGDQGAELQFWLGMAEKAAAAATTERAAGGAARPRGRAQKP